jgi:membrane protease YdiL (CAAX protease family)
MMPPTPPAPQRPDLGPGTPPTADPHDVPWRWWHAAAVFVGGFVLAGSLVSIPVALLFGGFDEPGTGVGLGGMVGSLVADAAFVTVMVVWLRSRTRDPAAAVRFPDRGSRLRDLRDGLGIGLLMYPIVAIGLGIALTIVFEAITGRIVRAPEQLAGDLSPVAVVVALVFGLVAAPITEELFWRGILYRSLRRHGFWAAASVSAIGFGLVHYLGGPIDSALLLMLAEAGAGFGFALLYERRGLMASMGAHAAFNAIGLVAILLVG